MPVRLTVVVVTLLEQQGCGTLFLAQIALTALFPSLAGLDETLVVTSDAVTNYAKASEFRVIMAGAARAWDVAGPFPPAFTPAATAGDGVVVWIRGRRRRGRRRRR